MFTVAQARQALAEWFREKSMFREVKARDYSHDTRNTDSAEALERVARYIESLPDSDRWLRAFAERDDLFFPGECFSAPMPNGDGESESEQMAFRCGFDPADDPAEFFAEWVKVVQRESGDEEFTAIADSWPLRNSRK